MVRQVVLDTETTGLETQEGHRILELGCVEIIDRKLTRRHYHQYINPQREIDDGALEVHGISMDFLRDKPRFDEVWESFLEFIRGAELIIHNAEFDVAFLNYEIGKIPGQAGVISDYCHIIDSLELARRKHPGQKNSLDALCKRYHVDNSQRELHGALLDAEILADVYLLLTGGQASLGLGEAAAQTAGSGIRRLPADRPALKVIHADAGEIVAHLQKLDEIDADAETGCVWKQLETS